MEEKTRKRIGTAVIVLIVIEVVIFLLLRNCSGGCAPGENGKKVTVTGKGPAQVAETKPLTKRPTKSKAEKTAAIASKEPSVGQSTLSEKAAPDQPERESPIARVDPSAVLETPPTKAEPVQQERVEPVDHADPSMGQPTPKEKAVTTQLHDEDDEEGEERIVATDTLPEPRSEMKKTSPGKATPPPMEEEDEDGGAQIFRNSPAARKTAPKISTSLPLEEDEEDEVQVPRPAPPAARKATPKTTAPLPLEVEEDTRVFEYQQNPALDFLGIYEPLGPKSSIGGWATLTIRGQSANAKNRPPSVLELNGKHLPLLLAVTIEGTFSTSGGFYKSGEKILRLTWEPEVTHGGTYCLSEQRRSERFVYFRTVPYGSCPATYQPNWTKYRYFTLPAY